MPSFEIEVKFYIKNYEEIIKKTTQYAGNAIETGFEKNILFDTLDYSLKKKGQILRLRSYNNKNILTLKKPPEKPSSEFKILEETESKIESFENMKYILNNSGFSNEQIYEKERSVFKTDSLEIVIDKLPFGNFIEFEGSPSQIKKAADFFEFNWERRLLPSYRALFLQIKKDFVLTFNDITFKNFTFVKASDFSSSIEKFYKTF